MLRPPLGKPAGQSEAYRSTGTPSGVLQLGVALPPERVPRLLLAVKAGRGEQLVRLTRVYGRR
jgi:hypothetical protein